MLHDRHSRGFAGELTFLNHLLFYSFVFLQGFWGTDLWDAFWLGREVGVPDFAKQRKSLISSAARKFRTALAAAVRYLSLVLQVLAS